ncbi:hypothetical protein MASR2M78_09510 [Treponema sp.]
MKMKGRFIFHLLFVSLLVSLAGPLFSNEILDRITWSFRGSLLTILEENKLEGDPSPIIPSPGLCASYPILPFLSFDPSIDLYMTYYGYSYPLDRAVPYAIENRSALVIGTLFALPVAYTLQLPKDLVFHAFAGPAFDFRACLAADGLKGDDLRDAQSQTDKVAAYFWGAGRWFYPTLGLGLDFIQLGSFRFGFETRVWFPMYKLWTGEDLPAAEAWRLAAGLRIQYLK